MGDCKTDITTNPSDVYSCLISLRTSDQSQKSMYQQMRNFCMVSMGLLFLLFICPENYMGTQIIPYAAICFLTLFFILVVLYFSGQEQSRIIPQIDPESYERDSLPTIGWIKNMTLWPTIIIMGLLLNSYMMNRKRLEEDFNVAKKYLEENKDSDSKIDATFKEIDKNDDGVLSKKEFAEWSKKKYENNNGVTQSGGGVMDGGPPEEIFEIGATQMAAISTIPTIASTARFNLENGGIMWRIWSDKGIESRFGKKIPKSRAELYDRTQNRGFVLSVFVGIGIFVILLLAVVGKMRADPPKMYFTLCLLISAVCFIQCFIVHNSRMSLLKQIEREVSNGKVFTEHEASVLAQEGSMFSMPTSISIPTPEIPETSNPSDNTPFGEEPQEDAPEGDAAEGDNVEGFENPKPKSPTLEDLLSWYSDIQTYHDPYGDYDGEFNDIKRDIEAYKLEIDTKNAEITERNSRISEDEEPEPLHTIDVDRLKNLQDRMLTKYHTVSTLRKIPPVTAGDDDIKKWLREIILVTTQNHPKHSKYKPLTTEDIAKDKVLKKGGLIDQGNLNHIVTDEKQRLSILKQYGYVSGDNEEPESS